MDETGANMSVIEYFHQRYGIALEYEYLPAFQYGTESKPLYLPMEVLFYNENFHSFLSFKFVLKVYPLL